jgi:hypothetical protein
MDNLDEPDDADHDEAGGEIGEQERRFHSLKATHQIN